MRWSEASRGKTRLPGGCDPTKLSEEDTSTEYVEEKLSGTLPSQGENLEWATGRKHKGRLGNKVIRDSKFLKYAFSNQTEQNESNPHSLITNGKRRGFEIPGGGGFIISKME